jgi:Transposase DDE domain
LRINILRYNYHIMSISMIPKAKEIKLISIYLYICDLYESELKYLCQRFSNNDDPEFTDQEVMTIYLYVMQVEQLLKIKQIHSFANDHLRSWFPRLHSYEAFNVRINRLSEAFKHLSGSLLSNNCPKDCLPDTSLVDSLPIITSSGKRPNSVAKELTDKGYCSTKNMYYYGSKLHALAFSRPGHLPFPESLIVTPASENDLNVQKQYWSTIPDRTFYGDKIYNDEVFFDRMTQKYNSKMMIPKKAVKGQAQTIAQRDKAANDLYSTAVSRIRQPIEAFFNWLIEKTDIQRASKVRSTNGLIIHIFGRIAAAYIFLIFNS